MNSHEQYVRFNPLTGERETTEQCKCGKAWPCIDGYAYAYTPDFELLPTDGRMTPENLNRITTPGHPVAEMVSSPKFTGRPVWGPIDLYTLLAAATAVADYNFTYYGAEADTKNPASLYNRIKTLRGALHRE